jgi:hypothetical protein
MINPQPANSGAPSPWAYTLPDATVVTGLSVATLRRRAKEGRLRLLQVGGRTLVEAASLRALLGLAEVAQ